MTIYATRPAMNPPAPEWLSLQQAATIYSVSVDTLRRRIRTGEAPGIAVRGEADQGTDRRSRPPVPAHTQRQGTRQVAPFASGANRR
jgi:hypothetical protein